jgi:hypothetical protein
MFNQGTMRNSLATSGRAVTDRKRKVASLSRMVACVGVFAMTLSFGALTGAGAQLTQFSTRAAFDAACPGLPVEDFEDARVAPGFVGGTGALDKDTTGGGFLPGDILDGLRLEAVPSNNLAILGDTSYGVSTKKVFANFDNDSLRITFYNGGVTCVGLDVSVLFDPAPVTAEFFDAAGNSLGSVTVSAAVAGDTFVGVKSSTPIDRVIISTPAGIYKGVDNIAFGAAPVDTTAPSIKASVDRSVLWPPNGKLVPVVVSGSLTDVGSGVDPASARYSVTDEYGEIQPEGAISLNSDGTFKFTVMLEASRRGTDRSGRQYAISLTGSDRAGNVSSTQLTVVVPHG